MCLWSLLSFTCSGVRVADECKRWNTHFSGSLVSYFLQNFQLQHRCLLNPSPAGRTSSQLHGWVTYTQRKHWDGSSSWTCWACPVSGWAQWRHSSGFFYRYFIGIGIMGRKAVEEVWPANFKWAFGEIAVREKAEHSLLCFPPSGTRWEQSRDTPAASDSLHSSDFSPKNSAQSYFQLRKHLLSTITQLWSCETNALSVTILWAQNK